MSDWLQNQALIMFILFLLFTFLGAILIGVLEIQNIRIRSVPFYIPFFTIEYEAKPEYGIWIGIIAASATVATFLSNYIGKRVFITYKFINYPSDHLKVLKSIKGAPKTISEISRELDILPSVTQRITGDLVKEGLLDKFGEGEKAVYYFAPEKKLAKLREGEY